MKNSSFFSKSNIPNILTLFRMLLVPIIVTLLLVPGGFVVYTLKTIESPHRDYSNITILSLFAGILFVLASLTDWIDGYIARKYNYVSNFGKLWDPIADKVLINSVLICFAYLQVVPTWLVVSLIARDIIVDASRMLAASKSIVVPANIYGKLKTVCQMVAIIFIFFIACGSSYTSQIMYWAVQNLAMYFALFFSLLSGGIYLVQISKQVKNHDQNKSTNN